MKNNFDTKDNVNSLSFMDTHDTSKLDMYGVFVKKKKDMKQLPDDEFLHLEDDLTQATDVPSFEDAAMSEKNDDILGFDDYNDIKDSQLDYPMSLEEPLPPLSTDIDSIDFEKNRFDPDDPFTDTADTLEDNDMLSFLGEDSGKEDFLSDTEEADDYLSDTFEDIALKKEDDFQIDKELDSPLFDEPEFKNTEDNFELPSDDDADVLMHAQDDDAFFDDLEALEYDLRTESNDETISCSENSCSERRDKSTELLMKIAKEIDNLKAELSTIKAELAAHSSRLLPENNSTDSEGQLDTYPAPANNSGFFSDDDTDETIALTGDELKNIVATSDDGSLHSGDQNDSINNNSSFNLDVKYINPISEDTGFVDEELVEGDEDDVLHDITAHWPNSSIDANTSKENGQGDSDEKALNTIPLEQEITVPVFEDTIPSAQILKDESIPDIPSFTEELVADSEDRLPVKDSVLDIQPESLSETKAAIEESFFDEKEADSFLHEEDTMLLEQPVSDEEAEIPLLSSEDADDELVLHEEHKAFFEEPVNDEKAEIPLLSSEDADDELVLHEEHKAFFEEPVSDEEAEIPLLSSEDADDELVLHEEHKAFFEEPVNDEKAEIPVLSVEDADDELLLHEEDAKPFEQPVDDEIEVPHLSEEDTLSVEDEQTDNNASEFTQTKDETVSMSLELKNEIKSVLVYMDRLLEALPEDKIEEFAKSEYFEVYKHLFEELGISD